MIEKNTVTAANKFRFRILPLLGVLVVLGIAVTVMMHFSGTEIMATDLSTVKTGMVAQQVVSGTLNLTGVLDADSKATITPQLSGVAAQVNVKEGSKVKKGDILVSLNTNDVQAQTQVNQARIGVQKAQAAVDQAKIAYDQAESNFEKQQQLLEAGALSQGQFDQIKMQRDIAKTQYDTALNVGMSAAQQALSQAQMAYDKKDITSPIDGVVVTCNVHPGDPVAPGVQLISIVNVNNLSLTGTVNESLLTQLQAGQKAEVEVDSLPGKKFNGTISFISPVSVPTGQFFPVKLTVQDPDGLLKPGMTANAKIAVETKSAVAVPKTAITRRDGRDVVFVVKDGKAVQTPVELGFEGDQYVTVEQGLKDGEEIVVADPNAVINGMDLPK